MSEVNELVIDGYRFGSMEDAMLAKMELQKIDILNQRLDYNNSNSVLLVYNKALENRVFKTPIGYEFMKKLQKYLLDNLDKIEDVQDIPLYNTFANTIRENPAIIKRRVDTKKAVDKKSMSLKTSILINIIMIIFAGIMFFITLDSKNPNIVNYEKSIVDRYAGWEQELSERENILREREKELNINE